MRPVVPVRKIVYSISVMVYFVLLVAHNIYQIRLVDYAWNIVLVFCFILGTVKKRIVLDRNVLALACIFIVFGSINKVLVGNSTPVGILSTVLYLGIYSLLSDENVEEKYILASICICCCIFIINFMKHGIGASIMETLSPNFVSVFLLFPSIVYYVRLESKGAKIPLLPAVLVMITSLMAAGRGGIITSALMVFFVLGYIFFLEKKGRNTYRRFLLKTALVVVFIMMLLVLLSYSNKLKTLAVFQRFTQYGMYGTGRVRIWTEYLEALKNNPVRVFLGSEYSILKLMVRYRNNLHNSFLNIHADYGIFVLIFVVFSLLSNGKKCVQNKRWIYLFMIVVFSVRAFTDKIAGGSSAGTPVLFFLMLFIYKDVESQKRKPNSQW